MVAPTVAVAGEEEVIAVKILLSSGVNKVHYISNILQRLLHHPQHPHHK